MPDHNIAKGNIHMGDEEWWLKNTSGLDAEGLCKAYTECSEPFVEMGKYMA